MALLCSNRPEFVEVLAAVQRAGLRADAHQLAPDGRRGRPTSSTTARRKAFIADARFAEAAREAARRAPAAPRSGSPSAARSPASTTTQARSRAERADDLDDPVLGSTMLYTSGTTGRPKGVYRAGRAVRRRRRRSARRVAADRPAHRPALCTGPLYHAAPLAFYAQRPARRAASAVVLMDRCDAEETLRLVERHRVTHTHMVPTMFHRLLALPDGDARALRPLVACASCCTARRPARCT